MSKVDEIMELLEGLTLLDASDLVTKIEDKFGVRNAKDVMLGINFKSPL